MRKVEKLSLLGWLIYSGLAGLCSFLVITIAHFNNIFTMLFGLLYVIFNGFIIRQLIILLTDWEIDVNFKKPIITRKQFECWFIVNLTLIITNYLLIPIVSDGLIQPLVFFFGIFEFFIIGMTINGLVTCFGNHFRYWFFKWFHKSTRLELFHKIKMIDQLLTVSSNDQSKNEQKTKYESIKPINFKREEVFK